MEGTDEVLVRKNKKITRAALKRLGDRDIAPLVMKKEELAGKVIARDIIDEATGEVVAPCNKEIALDEVDQFVEDLANRNIKSFDALFIEERIVSSSLRDTLLEDKIDDRPNRVIEDYRKQHPDDSHQQRDSQCADRDLSPAQAFQSGHGRDQQHFLQ